ncbi:beta-1 adrenergic receptor-like [Amphiura filiformis]|uniref:beta-1 adrenergic receptor-like n=1 Tax=Amphiura filiformis TaxID=82378 RepID=UPI003B21A7E5
MESNADTTVSSESIDMTTSYTEEDVVYSGLVATRTIVLIISSTLIIIGNIVNLIVLPKLETVQESTLVLLMGLAVIDLSTGLFCGIFGIPSAITDTWMFGRGMCVIIGLLYTTTVGFSLIVLLLISVDRYIAITRPLRYPELVNRKRAVAAMVASIASFPITLYFLGTVDVPFDNVTFNPAYAQCLVDFGNPNNAVLSITLLCSSVLGVIATIAVIYLRILCIAWKVGRAVAALRLDNPPGERQISRGFSKHEWKATRTTLIVTGGFTVAWLPYIITQIWSASSRQRLSAPGQFLVFILPTCNSWWNVLIYSVMNRQFRWTVKRMARLNQGADFEHSANTD